MIRSDPFLRGRGGGRGRSRDRELLISESTSSFLLPHSLSVMSFSTEPNLKRSFYEKRLFVCTRPVLSISSTSLKSSLAQVSSSRTRKRTPNWRHSDVGSSSRRSRKELWFDLRQSSGKQHVSSSSSSLSQLSQGALTPLNLERTSLLIFANQNAQKAAAERCKSKGVESQVGLFRFSKTLRC